MGNAWIWWTPNPGGPVYGIDFGEPLSGLEPVTGGLKRITAEGITGNRTTVHLQDRARWRVERTRIVDAAVAADWLALRNHLRRGGHCSLAEDADKAVAFFAATPPVPGANTIVPLGWPWPYTAAPTTSSGDRYVLQSPSPMALREQVVSTSDYTGGATTGLAVTGARFDYTSERWVLVRHVGFHPALRLPSDALDSEVVKQHSARINWTLDLVLEEANGVLDAWGAAPDSPIDTGTGTNVSLEDPPGTTHGAEVNQNQPYVWTAPR